MDTSNEDMLRKDGVNAFYTLSGVCDLLETGEVDIFERVFNKSLQAIATPDGLLMFPVAQFNSGKIR